MKKISMILLLLVFFLTSMAGCAGGEAEPPKETVDIAGDYTGTMVFSKVEIVYDTGEDSNGEETRSYYEPEGESEWLGESMPVNYRVTVNDDQTITLAGMDEDGTETEVIQGEYDQDKSRFYYVTEEIGGKNELVLNYAEADGMVTAKGTMLFTHAETGLVNEITIDLKKI